MAYNYSNPRKELTIKDWPWARAKTTAHFTVEVDPKRGERAVRVVIDPKTGRPAAAKKLTYAREMVIVDGDGRQNLHRAFEHVRPYHDHLRRYEVSARGYPCR